MSRTIEYYADYVQSTELPGLFSWKKISQIQQMSRSL